MVHWRWSIYRHTRPRSCKYLRVRAIVVPDRCQDDMSWGQDTLHRLISFSSPVWRVSVSVFVAHSWKSLHDKIIILTGHDWKVICSQFYSRCCLIICDVGHVGGVVKGPQGALVGRGRANASICLHFWHNVSKYFPHHNTTEKQCCLNWFQMGQKMETLIEILMFLTLVHKGPFTPSSVLTFFNLRTLAGDKEKLF